MLPARCEQLASVLERAELDLVEGRWDRGGRDHLVQLADIEVGDADRARVAELASPLHARPGPERTALGPVDDVEVDVVEAEPPQAPLSLGGRIRARGIELGRDEHVLARDAALTQRTADALLVAVGLGGVDVPVAEL